MRRYEVPVTPDNFALWYEYHSGENPALARTMDVIISNHGEFDETILHDLYASFISSAREEAIVRETLASLLQVIRELIRVARRAGANAAEFGNALTAMAAREYDHTRETLRVLIGDLIRESQRLAGTTQSAGDQMIDSSEQIATLERKLESALAEARIDGLTGLANRKSFDAAARRLAGEAMNSGDDLTLMMIDADHFKRVNDTWGHQVGDEVLCHIASLLKRSVRGEDFVARYGGEEFAIVLPRTDLRAAESVANNIRHALSRDPLRLNLIPPLGKITVSVGISRYEPGDPLASWISQADSALYRAKNNGRDCVQCA